MNVTLTAADLNKWLSYGLITINRIYGRNDSAAGDLYILLYDAPTAAASAVPSVAPLTCTAGTWFDWEKCPINMKMCYLALSTDANTLVAPSANQGMEITIEYDTDFPVVSGVTTVVGDLTTNVANRQVWASASGPKTLLCIDIVNNSVDDAYVIISAEDSQTVWKSNMFRVGKVADGQTIRIPFGDGFIPLALNSSNVQKQGCTVYFVSPILPVADSDQGVNLATNAEFCIRAIYE